MFQIDVMSRIPLYEQIIEQVEHFILTGILVSDEQLPSVRSLSIELSINPNTIQKAYSDLDKRGIIYSVPGKGCFVSRKAMALLSEIKIHKLDDLDKMLTDMALAGITREQILEHVDLAYKKKGDSND
jgi:GntR family transcriptional regulator